MVINAILVKYYITTQYLLLNPKKDPVQVTTTDEKDYFVSINYNFKISDLFNLFSYLHCGYKHIVQKLNLEFFKTNLSNIVTK